MYGFSKIRQRLVIVCRITGLDDAPFGEVFPLQATLPELEPGGSKYVVRFEKRMQIFLEIGQHVEESVLRSQHSLFRDDIGTTSIAWYLPANLDGIGLLERQQ